MMFNYSDAEYNWDTFVKDRDYMFNSAYIPCKKIKENVIYFPANLPSDQPIIAPCGPPIIPESKMSVIMNSIE